MKKLFTCLGLVALSTPMMAALSPYWDSAMQMKAVVQSPEVTDKIHGPLKAIILQDSLTYMIATEQCSATVRLEAHAPDGPGVTTYSVQEVYNAECQ